MKTNIYILLFFLVVFCITDCKKYPEGPRISLRTKKIRIQGVWYTELFLVNGEDSTANYIIPYVNCGCYNIGPKGYSIYKIGSQGRDGSWDFSNNKNNIVFYNNNGQGLPPLFVGDKVEWVIQRLTDKQFWLKRNDNNKEYYLKLKNPN